VPALPFEFPEPTGSFDVEPPRRKRRLGVILSLSLGLPILLAGGAAGYLWYTGAFSEPEPLRLSFAEVDLIDAELAERADLADQLATARADYRSQLSDWDQALQWAETDRAGTAQPAAAVSNPGGGAMPGGDPTGRAFLDSIGATDVTVFFEAGPENCGYSGTGGEENYLYAGGCFSTAYPNTLFMAWDDGADDMVWSIFVHEAMHWFQSEHYAEASYLASFAGIDFASYTPQWEADASCRAVYVHGMTLDDYVDSSSPCTVDGWYEGWIADYLASLGAHRGAPVAAEFEPLETSRP